MARKHKQNRYSLFTIHFTDLEEPRRTTKGNFQYPLEYITFFGQTHLEWLRKFYPFKNGMPSQDVLNRLFNRLDTKAFNTCFIKWVNAVAVKPEGCVIPIDGKTIRGMASKYRTSKLDIVSAFCSENELSLGQVKVESKSNDITAIPELLDLIAIKGCSITYY